MHSVDFNLLSYQIAVTVFPRAAEFRHKYSLRIRDARSRSGAHALSSSSCFEFRKVTKVVPGDGAKTANDQGIGNYEIRHRFHPVIRTNASPVLLAPPIIKSPYHAQKVLLSPVLLDLSDKPGVFPKIESIVTPITHSRSRNARRFTSARPSP